MYSKDGVRQERTSWRDEWISERHRHWGYDCPAVDLDFLMVEYDKGQPVALVEYKAHGQKYIALNLNHPTLRAVRILADNSRIPFLVVSYTRSPVWFRVTPGNKTAREMVAAPRVMSEFEYVRMLYRIRGMLASPDMLAGLSQYRPPDDISDIPF